MIMSLSDLDLNKDIKSKILRSFFSSPEPKAQCELLWSVLVRPSRINFSLKYIHFTGVFLLMGATKIAQMVLLRQTRGQSELQIRNLTEMYQSTKIAQMVPLHWTKGPPEL